MSDRSSIAIAALASLPGFFILSVPTVADGQVVISEIMYDVSSEIGADDKREWVEVFNAGSSSVDLSGWKINDGSNHILNEPPANGGTGSLALSPGAYAILTDDAATFRALYPGVATVIDTVLDLNNASGAVSLINADGAAADSLSYAKEIGAGGDGNSLHRQSVSSAELAPGAPSPGSGTLAAETQSPTPSPPPASSAAEPSSSGSGSYDIWKPPDISLDAGGDRVVLVGADAAFRAAARNEKGVAVDHLLFSWNFGDGSTARGAVVAHRFERPGRYAVVLTIAEDERASDRVIVMAEPARMSLSIFPDALGIENRAGRELDVSGWTVKSLGRSFALPAHSIILAGQTMHLSAQTLGFYPASSTAIYYPDGALALRADGADTADASGPPQTPQPVEAFAAAQTKGFSGTHASYAPAPAPSLRDAETPDEEIAPSGVALGESLPQTASASAARSSWGWWLGACAITLAGAGSALFARLSAKKEWDIIEG